jgi:hypothetical protein
MVSIVNRAKMTTATTGTGTITLGSASSGYQSFAAAGVANGDVVRYVIEDGSAWEIGTGTYTTSGTTLSRTPLQSSASGAAISLTGSAVVYISVIAAQLIPILGLYTGNPSSPTAPSAAGTNAISIGSGASAASNTSTALGNNSGGSGSVTATGAGAMALGGSRASGVDSFAAAIADNTSAYGATAANSVAIGQRAKATQSSTIAIGDGAASTGAGGYSIAIGYLAAASGAGSIAMAGAYSITRATASGESSIAIGDDAKATQKFSTALGSSSNSIIIGKYAYAGGRLSATGDSQTGTTVLRGDTTTATPEALTTDNSAAAALNQVILPNSSAFAFSGIIVARQQRVGGTASAAWKIEGLIRREANAASTVLVASTTTPISNLPLWGLALSADTTNGGLKVEVTGAAATNISWVATVYTSEVTY